MSMHCTLLDRQNEILIAARSSLINGYAFMSIKDYYGVPEDDLYDALRRGDVADSALAALAAITSKDGFDMIMDDCKQLVLSNTDWCSPYELQNTVECTLCSDAEMNARTDEIAEKHCNQYWGIDFNDEFVITNQLEAVKIRFAAWQAACHVVDPRRSAAFSHRRQTGGGNNDTDGSDSDSPRSLAPIQQPSTPTPTHYLTAPDDPDPDDRLIPDPWSAINTHEQSRPENRVLRKAILAGRECAAPTVKADKQHLHAYKWYTSAALADIRRAMGSIISRKTTLGYQLRDDIDAAAVRLFLRLVTDHDFDDTPNPVASIIVQRLAFKDTDKLHSYARGGIFAGDTDDAKKSRKLDREIGIRDASGKWDEMMDRVDGSVDVAEVAYRIVDDTATAADEVDDADATPDPDSFFFGQPELDAVLRIIVEQVHKQDLPSRASAIFAALTCVTGCDTVQHRVARLQTVVKNTRHEYAPELVQTAQVLLESHQYQRAGAA